MSTTLLDREDTLHHIELEELEREVLEALDGIVQDDRIFLIDDRYVEMVLVIQKVISSRFDRGAARATVPQIRDAINSLSLSNRIRLLLNLGPCVDLSDLVLLEKINS